MSSANSEKEEEKPPKEEDADSNPQEQIKEPVDIPEEDQKEEVPEENKKIFVKNIPFNTSDEELKDFFSKYGNVINAQILKNPENNQSKGVGIVEFKTLEEKNAVLNMNSDELKINDRKLEVREAREKRDFNKTIFVGNITYETTEEKLHQFFEDVAKNFEVKIQNHNKDGKSKGYAYVYFETQEDAENALSKNKKELDGRILTVEKKRIRNENTYRRGRGRFRGREERHRGGYGYHRYDHGREDYYRERWDRDRSREKRYREKDRDDRHRSRDREKRYRDRSRGERDRSREHERRERSSRDRDRRHSHHDRDKI